MAKNPTIKKDMDYFKRAVKEVKDPEDLFKDYRLLKIVLSAYGLESEINKIALVKKTLMSDPDDINSLVNKMKDSRYRDMHKDLRLDLGLTHLNLNATAIDLEKNLISVSVEKELDAQAPGIRRAINFKKVADKGDIDTAYDLLGNANLRDVALKARGIPIELVRADIDTQGRTLEKHFDFDLFDDDPDYVDKIIQQYLVNIDIENAQSANNTASFASMLLGATDGFGLNIEANLLV